MTEDDFRELVEPLGRRLEQRTTLYGRSNPSPDPVAPGVTTTLRRASPRSSGRCRGRTAGRSSTRPRSDVDSDQPRGMSVSPVTSAPHIEQARGRSVTGDIRAERYVPGWTRDVRTPPAVPHRRRRARPTCSRAARCHRCRREPRPALRDPRNGGAARRRRRRPARPQDHERGAEGDAGGVPGVRAVPRHAEGHDLRLGPHAADDPSTRRRATSPRAGWPRGGWSSPAPARGSWPPGSRARAATRRSASTSACRSSRRPNPFIAGDAKLVSMKYFFTRKLMLIKESHGFVSPARRVRHARRDLRAAHADADRQGDAGADRAARRARRHVLAAVGSGFVADERRAAAAIVADDDLDLFLVTDDVDEPSTRSSASTATTTRSAGSATSWSSGCGDAPTTTSSTRSTREFADIVPVGRHRASPSRCPPRSQDDDQLDLAAHRAPVRRSATATVFAT